MCGHRQQHTSPEKACYSSMHFLITVCHFLQNNHLGLYTKWQQIALRINYFNPQALSIIKLPQLRWVSALNPQRKLNSASLDAKLQVLLVTETKSSVQKQTSAKKFWLLTVIHCFLDICFSSIMEKLGAQKPFMKVGLVKK